MATANQVALDADVRTELGKGATGRLRKEGRTPGILYGAGVEATPVHVDALDLYHALHTAAGTNVLIQLHVDGDEHLTFARDLQSHPVRGDMLHVDFLAVHRDTKISVDIPVHLVNDETLRRESGGVVNQIEHTLPIFVGPLDVPNYFELDVEGMEIGDVKRVEDLISQLPPGAEFEIDHERTVVTVNPPDILEEPEPAEGEEEGLEIEGEVEGEAAEGEAVEGEAAGEEADTEE